MPKYYSFEKGKYGGAVGTIYPFPKTLDSNTSFLENVPAGYLRCDGSVLNADEYVALARVIGIGDECIYKKANQVLDNADENGLNGQIQLPDLGSKYITAFSSNTGIILDSTAPNPTNPSTTRERVGVGVDLTLNQGTEITFNYSGNITVPTTNIPITGNYVMTLDGSSSEGFISEEQILAHGHYVNAARLKTASPPSVSFALSAPNIPNNDQYTGSGGYTVIEYEEYPTEIGGSLSSTGHFHSLSRTNPTHNAAANINSFNLDGSPITTTVTLASENTTAFNDIVQKFILVEYLIKY